MFDVLQLCMVIHYYRAMWSLMELFSLASTAYETSLFNIRDISRQKTIYVCDYIYNMYNRVRRATCMFTEMYY